VCLSSAALLLAAAANYQQAAESVGAAQKSAGIMPAAAALTDRPLISVFWSVTVLSRLSVSCQDHRQPLQT